jgi:hypothetical protein
MKLKKSIVIGTTLAVLSLPIIANADLITINKTSEYSSVIATSNKNLCSGGASGGVTYPYSTNTTTATQVKIVCGTANATCVANVVMETSLDAAKKCSGTVIGTAYLRMSDNVVTSVSLIPGSGYTVSGVGSNTITLSKV